jgi:hypothetical protein
MAKIVFQAAMMAVAMAAFAHALAPASLALAHFDLSQ